MKLNFGYCFFYYERDLSSSIRIKVKILPDFHVISINHQTGTINFEESDINGKDLINELYDLSNNKKYCICYFYVF